jgi:hypothetical protein
LDRLLKIELAKIKNNRQDSKNKLIRYLIHKKAIPADQISDRIDILIEHPERFSQNQLQEYFEVAGLDINIFTKNRREVK